MAEDTKVQLSRPARLVSTGAPVERAVMATDGSVTIRHDLAKLSSVDVADVDMLLGFSDGSHVVIPNGALEALDAVPHPALFPNAKSTLADLFKLSGIASPAKAVPTPKTPMNTNCTLCPSASTMRGR